MNTFELGKSLRTASNDEIKNFIGYLDITSLNAEELLELGFGKWNSTSNLLLIPSWIFPFIDPELDVTSIFDEVVKFEDIDTDTRFGCYAYGIVVPPIG